MSSSRNHQAWEKVLAAIEADTLRAAALLANDPAAADLDPAELARRAIADSGAVDVDVDVDARTDYVGAPQYTYLDDATDRADTHQAPVRRARPRNTPGMTSPTGANSGGVPANWRLPANSAPAATPELPDPADMPPIPAELRARIERLQDRINSLKVDLAKAMAEVRAVSQPAVRLPTEETPPGFVDRRI